MIGILIITHGKMATGIMDSVEMIMGKQTQCGVISLQPGDDINLFGEKIRKTIEDLNQEDGVLVLVDLLGASPYNQTALSYPHLKGTKYRLITGVNLPMVMEAFFQQKTDANLEEVYLGVMDAGMDGIKEFFDLKNNS